MRRLALKVFFCIEEHRRASEVFYNLKMFFSQKDLLKDFEI